MPTRPPAKHAEAGWSLDDELLLYVIHGTLHLVGYGDKAPKDAARMEQMQRNVLAAMRDSRREPSSQAAIVNIRNVEEGAQRS